MKCQSIDQYDLEELQNNPDRRSIVLLRSNSEYAVDAEGERFLELLSAKGFGLYECTVETPFDLLYVRFVVGPERVDVPVLVEFDGWEYLQSWLDPLSRDEELPRTLRQMRLDQVTRLSGRIADVDDWVTQGGIVVSEPDGTSVLLLILEDGEGVGHVLAVKEFLMATTPEVPDHTHFTFDTDTVIEFSAQKSENDQEDLFCVTITDNGGYVSYLVREAHLELIRRSAESLGWKITDEQPTEDEDLHSLDNSGTTIALFEGQGRGNTKPFVVSHDYEYFDYSWHLSDSDGDIAVYSTDEPDIYLEYNSSQKHGSTTCYRSGRFYFRVDCAGSWRIQVTVSEDALKARSAGVVPVDNSHLAPIDSPVDHQFIFWHQLIDGLIMKTPRNVDEQFRHRVRNAPGFNFVEDLGRGFILSPDGQSRASLSQRQASSVRDQIIEMDSMWRSLLPPCEVNRSTGEVVFVSPIDISRAQKKYKSFLRARIAVGKVLAKIAPSGQGFMFAVGHTSSVDFQIFICSDNDYQQMREDRADIIQDVRERHREATAPQRFAGAWFDEGRRRGLF